MATTGVIPGDDILLYVGEIAVSHSTSHSLSLNGTTIDITNKDTAGFEKFLNGRKNWSISIEGMVAYDATYGYEDLFDAWLAGTELTVKFSTEVAGDIYFTGPVIIENLEKSAGGGAVTTFTCSLKGNGAIAKATVAA